MVVRAQIEKGVEPWRLNTMEWHLRDQKCVAGETGSCVQGCNYEGFVAALAACIRYSVPPFDVIGSAARTEHQAVFLSRAVEFNMNCSWPCTRPAIGYVRAGGAGPPARRYFGPRPLFALAADRETAGS